MYDISLCVRQLYFYGNLVYLLAAPKSNPIDWWSARLISYPEPMDLEIDITIYANQGVRFTHFLFFLFLSFIHVDIKLNTWVISLHFKKKFTEQEE